MKSYYVYIATNQAGTLYIGVTNNLERRMQEHRSGQIPGFTADYKINKLIYFEETPEIEAAIVREKQLKGWRRSKKLALIDTQNPKWRDLASDPSTGSG